MAQLSNRVALVTGGGSGIGKAVAVRFAQHGAAVAILDFDEHEGAQVAVEISDMGQQACFLHCDVSNPEHVERAVAGTLERFGRLDIVVANAGINGVWAPIDQIKPQEWDRTHDINLKGTFLTLHYTIPHLRNAGGGSIIITSSVNGSRTFSSAGASAYSASKAGQVALMKMAALELAEHRIRVNAICPGAIHTNIGENTQKRDTESVAIKVEFPEGAPGIDHGVGDPFEVADVCLFLASHASRHVSGVEIYVDGGASLLR